jgi:hypothetical protein
VAGYLQNPGARRQRDSEGAYDSVEESRRGTKRKLKPPAAAGKKEGGALASGHRAQARPLSTRATRLV